MSGQNGQPTGAADGNAQNPNNGNEGQQQPNNSNPTTKQAEFDPSNLTNEQLQKVLENPNLWQNDRLKGLLASEKQLKTLEKEKEEAEAKALTEQGKFKELADKKAEEATNLAKQLQTERQNSQLSALLYQEGAVNVSDALKLIDRSGIKIDDSGSVTGLTETVAALKTNSPYLFGEAKKTTIGTATNGQPTANGDGAPRRFKASELKDPAFYKAHRDEILAAAKSGLIDQNA